MISVAMSAEASAAAASAVTVTLSSRPSHRAAENHRRRARQMPRQQRERLAELPGPRAGDRVIERDDEAGRGRRVEAPLDQLPWLEIVGQRQRAEIVAERRAGAGRDREHGGDARHDGDVERAPGMRSALHRLATPRRPWRTRRGRRPRRRRRWRHRRHGAARLERARLPRDCRTRAASGSAAPARGRDKAHSRKARRRPSSASCASCVR